MDVASGMKVAFIGAIAQDVPYKLSPGTTEGLTFSDPIARINSLAASLKGSGTADVVIAMLDDDVKNNYTRSARTSMASWAGTRTCPTSSTT